ncbi:hypothetical protein DW199_19620 [Klebsiella pneumoniae]|nr:hypothetical protein DW199_19620 [Klebsiella pneumoniae]
MFQQVMLFLRMETWLKIRMAVFAFFGPVFQELLRIVSYGINVFTNQNLLPSIIKPRCRAQFAVILVFGLSIL